MSQALEAAKFLRDLILTADVHGTMFSDRVYFSMAPQDKTFPMIVYEVISRAESPTQDNASAVDEYRFQVDVMAKTTASKSAAQAAHEAAHAVRQVLTRKDNRANNKVYKFQFDTIQEVNHLTDYAPDYDIYRVSNDYIIRVK